jgi:hypothetical protein
MGLAKPRNARSAALLKGMLSSTTFFSALPATKAYRWGWWIGASGALNGGRPT